MNLCSTTTISGVSSIEVLFGALGIIPTQRDNGVFTEGPTLNYTTILNIAFLVLAAVLVWRFLRTGGPEMLKMMDVAEPVSEHQPQVPS